MNSITWAKVNSKASSKDKIISILSKQWPLTSKEIFERLKREYAQETTYQAAHKTIQELVNENILEKDGNKYGLSKIWIMSNQQFFAETAKLYQNNKQNQIKGFDGTIIVEFKSYSKCVVWLAETFASKQLVGNGDNILIALFRYGMWPLKFKFDDFLILMKLLGKATNGYPITKNKTPFGKWIMKQYERAGATGMAWDHELTLEKDTLIHGDSIVEVEFTPEFEKFIEETYSKISNLEDLLKFFITQKEPETIIKVAITRNPSLAGLMRKQVMQKYFKGVGK